MTAVEYACAYCGSDADSAEIVWTDGFPFCSERCASLDSDMSSEGGPPRSVDVGDYV